MLRPLRLAFPLALDIDMHALYHDRALSGLMKQVVAVAGTDGKQEQFAAVVPKPDAARMLRAIDGERVLPGPADRHAGARYSPNVHVGLRHEHSPRTACRTQHPAAKVV